MNKHLQNLLEQAGLNEKEAAIYLSALELGQTTILEISKHSKIKRPTVYEIIPTLEQRGLIKASRVGKKNCFVAEDPKTVIKMFQEKEARYKEALPELSAIFNAQEDKPKVFFYHGKEEVQIMYEDTLRQNKPIYNFTSIINLYSYLDKDWVQRYVDARVKQKLVTKIIALDSPESREWEQTSKEELRQIKLIPKGEFNYSGDIHIYGNKAIITTYKKNLLGIMIEDENIVQMLRNMFEIIWAKDKR